MEKIFHGEVRPKDFANALIAEFDQGNLRAQQLGAGKEVVVQIATRNQRRSGGQTALTVTLESVADGVAVEVGKQSWFGVAASLRHDGYLCAAEPFHLAGTPR